LRVIDDRPDYDAGKDRKTVGRLRDQLGMPITVTESSGDEVARLIEEATEDALRRVAIATRMKARRTVVARLKRFWFDGYVGYKAGIEVDLTLLDDTGATVWHENISGVDGGTGFGTFTGVSFIAPMMDRLLNQYSAKAMEQFASTAFRSRLD
jgi:hypothetical protein